MFIVPISSSMNTTGIQSLKLSSEKPESGEATQDSLGFSQLFQEAIQNVEATEAVTRRMLTTCPSATWTTCTP